MGIADSELIHHCGRLVGINDHDFAGRQSAGEDPHSARRGIHLMQLFSLLKSWTKRRQKTMGLSGLLDHIYIGTEF